jgi:glyoxylase I family protein
VRARQLFSQTLFFAPHYADWKRAKFYIYPPTGLVLGLHKHPEGTDKRFTELNTGLDHVGFRGPNREGLVEWEARSAGLNVPYTPIRDMELGSHLNFRDPDNIALEFFAPYEQSTLSCS